jgi:hypothetical protein
LTGLHALISGTSTRRIADRRDRISGAVARPQSIQSRVGLATANATIELLYG